MTEDKQLVTEGKKSGDTFFNILAIVVGFIIASVLGYLIG